MTLIRKIVRNIISGYNNWVDKISKVSNIITKLLIIILFLLISNVTLLCIIIKPEDDAVSEATSVVSDAALVCREETDMKSEDVNASEENKTPVSNTEGEIMYFNDVTGAQYEMTIDPSAARHNYDVGAYSITNGRFTYNDDQYTSRLGIDVSHHQGKIKWKKVASDGIEFAMVRIGFRGYGSEGRLVADKYGKRNIKKAKEAGLDVGVYFFSQAVNEDEAREEARMVLDLLGGTKLDLPVVFDPESIPDDNARTDNVTGEQFTKNCLAFCEVIREAGYEPMIYSNMIWEAYKLDMGSLQGIPIWYADYQRIPQTPYDYCMWQYSESGRVAGVEGGCDMDIQVVRR